MKTLDWVSDQNEPRTGSLLFTSALIAFLIETVGLTIAGRQESWFSTSSRSAGDEFIEAQVLQIPSITHLVEEKKVSAQPQVKETVLSHAPGKGVENKEPSSLEEENKTEAGPKLAPTHGPVAIYAPPPVIPPYLQNKELKTHVVIDFYVSALGQATPRLVGTSGNEELDAIALRAIEKWQFRPAEKEGKPTDSKVRLRIMFEVN